jgi:hypothetical protein
MTAACCVVRSRGNRPQYDRLRGHKIGILEAVYVGTISDEPSFVTVKVGMISRHR